MREIFTLVASRNLEELQQVLKDPEINPNAYAVDIARGNVYRTPLETFLLYPVELFGGPSYMNTLEIFLNEPRVDPNAYNSEGDTVLISATGHMGYNARGRFVEGILMVIRRLLNDPRMAVNQFSWDGRINPIFKAISSKNTLMFLKDRCRFGLNDYEKIFLTVQS